MNDQELRAAIAALLRQQSTLTLATVSAAGQLMAADLFFAADEALRLVWVSGPHSRHSRNLQHHPGVAITVHAATWRWTDIGGVQLEGTARLVPPGSEWQTAWALYLAKFPFAEEFQAEISRSNFYVFTPVWGRLIDNARGFGYKAELSFSLTGL